MSIKKIQIEGVDHIEETKEVTTALTQSELLVQKENLQKTIAVFQAELVDVEAKLALC